MCMSTAAGGGGEETSRANEKGGGNGGRSARGKADRSEDYFDEDDQNLAVVEGLAGAYQVVKLLGSGGRAGILPTLEARGRHSMCEIYSPRVHTLSLGQALRATLG